MRFAFWLKCVFGMHIWGLHLHLHFDCNAHILEEMCIWGIHFHLNFGCNTHILEEVRASHLCLHVGCNEHLFWRRCTFKYNCIHMFVEEMTLIKYYCNLYHISSRIEENKTNFASWMHEPYPYSITSHFRWDAIN